MNVGTRHPSRQVEVSYVVVSSQEIFPIYYSARVGYFDLEISFPITVLALLDRQSVCLTVSSDYSLQGV